MKKFYLKRLAIIQEQIRESEGLFVSLPVDVSYITGFTGDDSYLLMTKEKVYFITDGRYIEQIKQQAQIPVIILEIKSDRRLITILTNIIKESRLNGFLFFKKDISLEFYESIQESLKNETIVFKNSRIIKDLRMSKDKLELEIIRENLIITELGYNYIIRLIEEGKKESEIAAELEYFLRKRGADKPSFDTIVSSGERTILPHGTATDKKIAKNDLIMLDFGILKNGYCSDFTRCYILGKIYSPKIKEIHQVVLDSLKTAQNSVKPGIRANQVHKTAYDVIAKAGYAEYFVHSTGHGVGLEIHELPFINSTDDTVLKEGMVFTTEPGIYLPGTGGIRLEDMVVVTEKGCEVLTSASYDL
jgi:Xaa-Pro aminopeptidase